jgi:chaperone protein EcpD
MMNKHSYSYSFPLFPGLFKAFSALALSLLVLGVATRAQADMTIDTTRIIYLGGKRDVTFKISNISKEQPSFVQLWLDDGNISATAEDAVSPFNLTPPVARINAGASQVVRMVFTGEPLPPDRESIFYFNMLELPQKSASENKLSFAVRTRIKVFYRPEGIKGEPISGLDQVTWKIVQKDKEWVAEGSNPTPFYLSFFSLALDDNEKFEFSVDGNMLPPMGKLSVRLGEVGKMKQTYKAIKVNYINDYGGATPKVLPISFPK